MFVGPSSFLLYPTQFASDSGCVSGLSPQEIAIATSTDPVLKNVLKWTRDGWPTSVSDEYTDFFRKRIELSTSQDCLLWRDRVVIPVAVRPKVLRLIHSTHQGEKHSKTTARSIVWWPRIDQDVVNTVKTCAPCQENAKAPPKKISPWPPAESPRERVHFDYFGPFQGHCFLLAVDSYSGWPVVKLVSNLSASVHITHVRYIFADYGRPHVVVTDNGASFASAEFNQFLEKNGVKHLYSPPWHPASNGPAERNVATVKSIFKKLKEGDVHAKIARTLWAMRTAPSSIGNRTPAEMMGRPFRTHLTEIHPDNQPTKTPTTEVPARCVGSHVWVRRHHVNGSQELRGVIQGIHGGRCFDVELESGSVMKNVSGDHLRPRVTSASPTHVSYLNFAPDVNVSDSARNPSGEPVSASRSPPRNQQPAGSTPSSESPPSPPGSHAPAEHTTTTTTPPGETPAQDPPENRSDDPRPTAHPTAAQEPTTSSQSPEQQVSHANPGNLSSTQTNFSGNAQVALAGDTALAATDTGTVGSTDTSGPSRGTATTQLSRTETRNSHEETASVKPDTPYFGFSDADISPRRSILRRRTAAPAPPAAAVAKPSSGVPDPAPPVSPPPGPPQPPTLPAHIEDAPAQTDDAVPSPALPGEALTPASLAIAKVVVAGARLPLAGR